MTSTTTAKDGRINKTSPWDSFCNFRGVSSKIALANHGSFGQKITTISPQTRTDTYFTPRRLSLHTLCVGECANSSTR